MKVKDQVLSTNSPKKKADDVTRTHYLRSERLFSHPLISLLQLSWDLVEINGGFDRNDHMVRRSNGLASIPNNWDTGSL